MDWEGANRRDKARGGQRASSSTSGLRAVYASNAQCEELRDLGYSARPRSAEEAKLLLFAYRPLAARESILNRIRKLPDTAAKLAQIEAAFRLLEKNFQKAIQKIEGSKSLGTSDKSYLRKRVERRRKVFEAELERIKGSASTRVVWGGG